MSKQLNTHFIQKTQQPFDNSNRHKWKGKMILFPSLITQLLSYSVLCTCQAWHNFSDIRIKLNIFTFLFHIDYLGFCFFFFFTETFIQNQVSKKNIIKGTVQFKAETMNCSELALHAVSNRCCCMSQKMSTSSGALVHSLGCYGCLSIQFGNNNYMLLSFNILVLSHFSLKNQN